MGVSLGHAVKLPRVGAPVNLGSLAQAKRCLIVDVDTVRQVGERDDVHVVGWVLLGRLDGRLLDQAREPLAIAIDGWINPVAYGYSWSFVRIGLVDRWGGEGGCRRERGEQQRGGGSLHDGRALR